MWALILSFVFISGCAQKVWVNPSVTQEKAQRDLAECQYDAEKYGYVQTWGTGVGAGIEEAIRKNELMSKCMTLKGYQLSSQDQLNQPSSYQANSSLIDASYANKLNCQTDSDCESGQKCRSKKSGGGSECRVSNEEITTNPSEPNKFQWKN